MAAAREERELGEGEEQSWMGGCSNRLSSALRFCESVVWAKTLKPVDSYYDSCLWSFVQKMSFGSYQVLFPWNVETSTIFYLYSNWLFDCFYQIAKLTDCRSKILVIKWIWLDRLPLIGLKREITRTSALLRQELDTYPENFKPHNDCVVQVFCCCMAKNW